MGKTRGALAIIVVVLSFTTPSGTRACGPGDPPGESVEDPRTALRHLLRDTELPLLDPSWYEEYWILAWARESGKTFSDAETQALLAHAGDLHLSCPDCGGEAPGQAWVAARRTALEALGDHDVATPVVDRMRQEDGYAYVLMCFPDAFDTAVETLAARRSVYSEAELRAWITAQDAVFHGCSDRTTPLPTAAPADASTLVREDREYQIAAALLHDGSFDEAATHFDAIASTSSRWADISRYRAAFAHFSNQHRDVADLRARLALTTDVKARRGLTQLIDRAELYTRPHPEIVAELGQRLLTQDLGEDIVRVVRDLARFANTCDTDLGAVLTSWGCEEGAHETTLRQLRAALSSADAPAPPTTARHAPLRITVAYLEARHAIHGRALASARASVRRGTTLARRSSVATRVVFHELALALAPSDPPVAALISTHGTDASELHAPARSVLRMLSSAQLLALAQGTTLSEDSRREIADVGIVRSVLLDRADELRAFLAARPATSLLPDPSADRIAQLSSIMTSNLSSFEDADEMQGYQTMATMGCSIGGCRSGRPDAIAVSAPVEDALLTPSADRVALVAHGNRLDALGAAILTEADAHRDDARVPDLLAAFVHVTRSASFHGGTDTHTATVSRGAFERLHGRYPDTDAARRTPHWFR